MRAQNPRGTEGGRERINSSTYEATCLPKQEQRKQYSRNEKKKRKLLFSLEKEKKRKEEKHEKMFSPSKTREARYLLSLFSHSLRFLFFLWRNSVHFLPQK
jgi:hypothetical protein